MKYLGICMPALHLLSRIWPRVLTASAATGALLLMLSPTSLHTTMLQQAMPPLGSCPGGDQAESQVLPAPPPPAPAAPRSWVALRLKDRWVQRLLDQRARTPARALSREIDQVLLPMSSVISWVTVVVRPPPPC